MKHCINCKSLLRLCLSVAMLLSGQVLSAADYICNVTMNGIYYLLYSDGNERYAVVSDDPNVREKYSGNIRIPSSLYNNGEEYPVTEIADNTFQGCTGLTSLTLPDGLKKIGRWVFLGCTNLKSISIPKSVTQIYSDAFNSNVPEDYDDPRFTDPGFETIIFEDGTEPLLGIYTDDPNALNVPIQLCESVKTLYLGRNVDIKCLGDCKLEEVTVGSTVTELTSSYFFHDSPRIRVVNIKDSSQPLHIDRYEDDTVEGLFSKCALESVYIGRDIEYDSTDGITPFAGIATLSSVTIGDNVTSIGESLFSGCTGLQSVTMGNGVSSIGSNAFLDCTGLQTVTMGSGVRTIGSNAFLGCTGLQGINIPNISVWLGFSFSSAEENPLYYAKNLYLDGNLVTNLTIPSGITVVSDYIFDGYDKLKSLTVPSTVESIGRRSFGNCSELKEVTFEDSENPLTLYDGYRTTQSNHTFADVPIETLYLGRNVESEAFHEDLAHLKKVHIGQYVTAIKNQLFRDCTEGNLTEVHISDLAAWCGIDFEDIYCNPLSKVHSMSLNGNPLMDLVIPAEIRVIKPYTFYEGTFFQTVTLHSKVTEIGNYAFYGCAGLTKLEIPNSVHTIGLDAFSGINITSLTIPTSVRTIRAAAFRDCKALSDVVIEGYPNELTIEDSFGAFSGCPIKTLYIGRNINGLISLSSSLNSLTIGSMVTRVSNNFYGYADLETLVLEDSDSPLELTDMQKSVDAVNMYIGRNIKMINSNPIFSNMDLVNVEIGDKVNYINYNLFNSCRSLETVKMAESVTAIYGKAFYDCSSLQSVEIPSSVESIGEYAFYGCSSLQSVAIPSSVESIGERTFYGCQALQSVAIPSGVESIGREAFYGCSSLQSVEIPSGVESIAERTFYGCQALQSVVIPSSVTSIGRDAFAGCTQITDVYSLNPTPPTVYDGNEFDADVYSYATLHVPYGLHDTYKAAVGWRQFYYINEMSQSTGIANVEADGGMDVSVEGGSIVVSNAGGRVAVYDLSGAVVGSSEGGSRAVVAVPGPGVYVVKAGGKAVKVRMKN